VTQQRTPLSFYEDFLKNFLFVFFPTTNWQHALSPALYFGCNVEDAPVEQHVLDEVGSYGSQINRMLDVLTVLVAKLDPKSLTAEQQDFVRRFEELASQADAAAASFQGKRRHSITDAEVAEFINRLSALKDGDPQRYRQIEERVAAAVA
jgi:hypothetical protein